MIRLVPRSNEEFRMLPVSRDFQKSRGYLRKSSRRAVAKDKVAARRLFRSRLKASDRRTNFEGVVSYTFTNRDVT